MTIATIVKSADVALSVSEFSLIKDSENVILGRLRFPPGVTRSAVRELIQDLKDLGYQIKKQQCIGDAEKTTAWSQLLFLCDLKMYQPTFRPLNCHKSLPLLLGHRNRTPGQKN